MSESQFIAALRSELGDDAVLEQPEDLHHYGSDRCRGGWPIAPRLIALPRTIEQVQALVRRCASEGIAIVPSGGRTGLTGAATATQGEVVLSLERMSALLELDRASRLLRCQAGMTVQAVQDAAASVGLLYPIDFAAKGSAHIGGSIATNAGGVKVLRYGLTREWVQGLEVVLGDGERLSLGGELVKNNTGYDLRQLLIGSEGTLGIIVEATLRLCTPPAGTLVALCSLPSDEAIAKLFARARASTLQLSAFECFDRGCVDQVIEHRGLAQAGPLAELGPQQVLIEVEHGVDERERVDDELLEVLGAAQEAGEVLDAVVAQSDGQARELWAWREDISESLHRHGPHKADVAVPVRRVVEFVTRWRALVTQALPDVPALVFGHVGDGNLHLNLLRPRSSDHASFLARVHELDPQVYALVRELQGSVSAEHGIGLLKREYLRYTRSAREIALMRSIKRGFDPRDILNPGKVFVPDPAEREQP